MLNRKKYITENFPTKTKRLKIIQIEFLPFHSLFLNFSNKSENKTYKTNKYRKQF